MSFHVQWTTTLRGILIQPHGQVCSMITSSGVESKPGARFLRHAHVRWLIYYLYLTKANGIGECCALEYGSSIIIDYGKYIRPGLQFNFIQHLSRVVDGGKIARQVTEVQHTVVISNICFCSPLLRLLST